MIENWIPVKGYEGFYEVSDHGRVKSLSRYVRCHTDSKRLHKGKILENIIPPDRYYKALLCRNGETKQVYIHTLVCEAFIGPRPKNSHCMHLDGDKKNNHISNLRYGSPSCNAAFMIDDGTVSRGVKRYNAKLDEVKVREIRKLAKKGISHRLIAEQYGIGRRTACAIALKQNWGWVR